MKTYNYIITLKERSTKLADRISLFMLLLAVSVFLFTLQEPGQQKNYYLFTIIVLITGWCIYCFVQRKKGQYPYYRLALIFASAGWFNLPDGTIPGIIYLVAALVEKQVKFPQEIGFDDEEIIFNSLPKRRVSWDQLNNVVLKDGLLTIDFTNNKLFQKETSTTVNARTEQEFNDFCKAQLIASRQ